MSDQIIDETQLTTGTVSPFLPGTKIQFAWDSTSLGLLKTCPRLYQYVMIDGWQAREESIHLRFGGEYHSALEAYDHAKANGESHEDAFRLAVRSALERTADWNVDLDTKAGKYKNRKSLIQLVVDYLDHFAEDPAQTVILSNGRPAVELSFRFELDFGPKAAIEYHEIHSQRDRGLVEETSVSYTLRQPYLLCGHLDRVVDYNDQLLVMDRKTSTTTLGSYYFRQYEPNNQMTLYTLAGKVVMDTPIRGVCIDAAQVKLEDPNTFARGFTYRTEDQLEEWQHDLEWVLRQNEAYAEADYWPMNDTACDKFGGCRFREVCSKSPQVREQFLRADFDKLEEDQRWNPLRSR